MGLATLPLGVHLLRGQGMPPPPSSCYASGSAGLATLPLGDHLPRDRQAVALPLHHELRDRPAVVALLVVIKYSRDVFTYNNGLGHRGPPPT